MMFCVYSLYTLAVYVRRHKPSKGQGDQINHLSARELKSPHKCGGTFCWNQSNKVLATLYSLITSVGGKLAWFTLIFKSRWN